MTSSTTTFVATDPPERPTIEGTTKGLRSGLAHQLTCRSAGGNPPARLTWLKDGHRLTTGVEEHSAVNGGVVSTVTFVPADDDDRGVIACQAMNKALAEPLETSVKLGVIPAPTTTTTTTTTTTKSTTNEDTEHLFDGGEGWYR